MRTLISKSKVKLRIEKLLITFSAFLLFLILGSYFIWGTYRGGILSSSGFPLIKVMYLLVIGMGLLYLMQQMRIQQDVFVCGAALLFAGIILGVLCGFAESGIATLLIANVLFLTITICYPIEMKTEIYDKFRLIFSVLLIPAIFFSLMAFIGINFPHDIILSDVTIKSNNYIQYLHYPFTVQITVNYDLLDNWNRFRVCGTFDEPGRVGTMCALFLASEKYNLKKLSNKIIMLGGILSLSVAFYLMMLIYFILDFLFGKNKKRAYILIAILIAVVAFKNIHFDNVALTRLQDRLTFTSGTFVANNRTNETFTDFMDAFFHDGDILSILLGRGSGSTNRVMTDLNNGYSSSFLALIYDFGVVGFSLIVIWPIFFWVKNRRLNNHSSIALILLILNLLNLYQRPSAFSPAYLYPFIGGIYMLNKNEGKIAEKSNI